MGQNNNLLDPELLADFHAGDEKAFDLVFNHFYAPLYFFAEGILHDAFVSEDLILEMMTKVWQRRNKFEDFVSLKSYLYLGVRNACLDQIKKNKVRQKHRDSFHEEPFDENNILYSMIRAEVVDRVFSAVDTLPEQCRKVIQMTFKEGKKPKEIADELGISVSTVNNQKMRGLLLLKNKLLGKDILSLVILFLPGFWR